MDPLTISASIGALLTIAVKLMTVTHSYGVSVKDFPRELQDLMAEVRALTGVLTALSIVYAPNTTGSGPMLTVDPFGGALDACAKCLKSAYESLENQNSGNKMRRVFKRITWPLNESDTKELFSRIERYKSTFSLAISSFDTTLRRATYDGIEELKNHEINKTAKKEKEKKSVRFRQIVRWLSSADPETNHIAAREIRQDGSGKWFTQGKIYKDWVSANSSFLWIHGKPGAGKTVLSSIIIDYTISELSANMQPNSNPVLIYFYCDFKDSTKQTIDSLLGSLIAQLLREKSEIPAELDTLYRNKFDEGEKPPNAAHLESCLHSILKGFSKVVAIIDAVDECRVEKRDRLCQRLTKLVGEGNLNLLVIGRDEPDIREEFTGLPELMIRDEDVSGDIRRYVTAEMDRQARLNRLKPSTKLSIVTTLVDEANGMFRWASCCLDEISKLRTDKAIRAALKSLPPTLEQSYERILCNIDERDKVLAIRVFQWLLFSHRPMNLNEITEAIAVELDNTSLDREAKLNEPEDIPQICGGLVRLDQRNMTLGLAHFTVKEYLVSVKISRSPAADYQIQRETANAEITKICFTYILFDDFSCGICANEEDLKNRLEEYPLLPYASEFWRKHFMDYQFGNDKVLDDLSQRFFLLDRNSGNLRSWFQVYCKVIKSLSYVFYEIRIFEIIHPLQIAIWANNYQAVDEIVRRGEDINEMCSGPFGGTPLTFAMSNNHYDMMYHLITKGADVNRRKLLEEAIIRGLTEVAKVLLKKGAEGPAIGYDGGRYDQVFVTSLVFRNEDIADVFLECDDYKDLISPASVVEDHENLFYIVLNLAISRGLDKIFRKYWDTDWGVDMMIERKLLFNVMLGVVKGRHNRFLRMIMRNKRANEECTKDESFGVLLREAAYVGGDEGTLELLLSYKEEVPKNDLGVALSFATVQGHTSIMEHLIRMGADPCYQDAKGWSPLLYASEYEKPKAVETLIAIEGVSESLKLAGMVGPTSWEMNFDRPGLEVSADGLEVKNPITKARLTIEAGDPILPLKLSKNYSFEVKVLAECTNPDDYISIGFGDAVFYRDSLWEPKRTGHRFMFEERDPELPPPYTVYSDKNWGFCTEGLLVYGEDFYTAKKYGAHDIVGCHFNGTENIAFFTLNGEIIGKAIGNIKGKLVPMVTLGPGAHIRANFGNEPLTYATPYLSAEMVQNAWEPRRNAAHPGFLETWDPLL